MTAPTERIVGNSDELTRAERIHTSAQLLIFSLRLVNAAQNNGLSPALFRNAIQIETGGEGLILSTVDAAPADILAACRNLVICAAVSAIISADEVLTEIVGAEPDRADDPNFVSVRAIVALLRHAFAHRTAAPRWLVDRRAKRVHVATMDDGAVIRLDATGLHGRPVYPEDHGGWEGFVRLLSYVQKRA